jgi:hypothetical protein
MFIAWPGVPILLLHPFRFVDPVSGRCVRARYVAERHELGQRYAQWEIIGPPEIRDADPDAAHFNPYASRAVRNVGATIAVAPAAGGERRRWVVGVAV